MPYDGIHGAIFLNFGC